MSTFTSKLNKIYQDNLGRNVKAEGAGYWKTDFDNMRKAGVSEADAMAAIEANIKASEEAQNPPTYQAPDRKHWQRGEDSTGPGNFHTMDLIKADPTKKEDFTDQITAYFEEKGLLAGTTAMDEKINTALGADTAADAFRAAMKSTPTGEERGDTWGTSGRDYLLAEAQKTNVDTSGRRKDLAANLINNLYTEGFGREADEEGLAWWTNQLYDHANSGGTKGMSYADIAGAFLGSDEARLRDVYHDEFGRDADDEGLQSWLSGGTAGVNAGIDYIKGGGSIESQMRDLYSTHMGQHSKAIDRDANYFTDVHEGGYKNLDWTGFTKDSGVTGVQQAGTKFKYDFGHGSSDWETRITEGLGLSDGSVLTGLAHDQANMTVDDLKKLLAHRERIQNIGSTYDTDDAEGGTNIGNLFTVKEFEEDYKLSDYEGNQDAYAALGDKLGGERWNLLTKELKKFYIGDTVPGYDKDDPVIIDPGTPQFDLDQKRTHRNTLHSDYDVPVPPDYADKPTATVTEEETDYMSKWDGSHGKPLDIPTYSGGQAKQISRSIQPFMAGQSAQGVRRKRSGAFRSGASATGTKQFQRKDNMKIQSLNL